MEFKWSFLGLSLFSSERVYWNMVLLDLNETPVHEIFWSQDREKMWEQLPIETPEPQKLEEANI